MYCIVNSIDPLDLKEDDNESECSDSWELLDYEPEGDDKAAGPKQESAKQGSGCGSTEQEANKDDSAHKSSPDQALGQEQPKSKSTRKPKVSFEIPDLVKEKQKIELTTPKVASSSSSDGGAKQSSSKAGHKKKQKQATASKVAADLNSQIEKTSIRREADSKSEGKRNKEDVVTETICKSEPIKKAQAQPCAKAPLLNYAAALSAKLENKRNEHETLPTMAKSAEKATQPKGAVKRNRPVSSSSWSSCDEEEVTKEDIAQMWDECEADKQPKQESSTAKLNVEQSSSNDDDKESMVSSGFSDCDYGYGGLNDYVMRPKKAQVKRRRNVSSTSSSLLTSMSKRGGDRLISPTKKVVDRASDGKDSASKQSVSWGISISSKHTKSKKKKLILSNSPATQSDFLKRTSQNAVQAIGKPSLTDYTKTKTTETKAESSRVTDEQQQLMPPPPAMPAGSTSGNDSSDIADMDESWYLTPPPCFTGVTANKLCIAPRPRAKEAARENLLIENPSIYFASTSKKVAEPLNKSAKDTLIKQKAIVLKKINRQQLPPSGPSSVIEKKAAPKSGKKIEIKTNGQSWDNKFVVTNWAYDDQEDVNGDFDNLALFPPLGSNQLAAPKTKKHTVMEKSKNARREKMKKSEKRVASERSPPTDTNMPDGYESDFSIPSPSSLEETSEIVSFVEKEVEDYIVPIENVEPKRRRNKSTSSEPKAPVQVKPIEPERQPGWQLRKKRSKRRPLASPTVATPSPKQSIAANNNKQVSSVAFSAQGEPTSVDCSARSTPTLIDRIGSSIVANLSNLTSGFASSTGMNMQARAPMNEVTEQLNQVALMTKSENGFNLKARKQLSKGYLARQNNCKAVGSTMRRADRRAKMHTTPNGCSVDRKVQTNFH